LHTVQLRSIAEIGPNWQLTYTLDVRDTDLVPNQRVFIQIRCLRALKR
jgi:hypothetical protein